MNKNFASLSLRSEVRAADREAVRQIVVSTGFFAEHEVAVAVELLDDRLEHPESSTYRFLFAEDNQKIYGYTCFGLIPCTLAGYDIYWIVVHESARGNGIGSRLLKETERAIVGLEGCRVYIETSGRRLYDTSRSFYEKHGYREAARLDEFYAPNDPKIIYEKILSSADCIRSL